MITKVAVRKRKECLITQVAVQKRREEEKRGAMVEESSGGRETKGMRVQLLAKVRRQAAKAVQSLLKGDADRRASASIRSLIYAPSIVAKKATLALTCQTLKCEFSTA